jgi:cytochrome P450
LAGRCPHLAEYNPFEPSHLADPYPLWTLSQREAPVFFIPPVGFWAVTGRDEILDVLKDTATYTSIHSLNLNPVPDELAERVPYGWPEGYPSLINTDPPIHTPIRKLAQKAITPREVAKREPEIREISEKLIDGFIDDGACDLMQRYAIPLPVVVIARVLGARDDDTGDFGQWGEDAFMMSNPMLTPEEILDRGRRLADLKDYLEAEIEKRRENPQEDLLSRLVHTEIEGEPTLTTKQVVSVAAQLLVGGNETTTHLIGNCMLLLRGKYPEIWERVCEDPSVIPNVVEETLRIKSSIRGLFRTTTREVQLGGQTLPAGSTLWMVFAAANHDESVFENAAAFDPDRTNLRDHLAFGKWTHFCIGAPLARLEAIVALEHLSQRLPGITLADNQELDWLPSPFTQGVTSLRMHW